MDLGLRTAYASDDRVRKLVWHLLSFAHIPLEKHHEAEDIIVSELDEFELEVGLK